MNGSTPRRVLLLRAPLLHGHDLLQLKTRSRGWDVNGSTPRRVLILRAPPVWVDGRVQEVSSQGLDWLGCCGSGSSSVLRRGACEYALSEALFCGVQF